MSDENSSFTTAEILGRFRKELISEGFDADQAQQLAVDWGRSLAATGAPLLTVNRGQA